MAIVAVVGLPGSGKSYSAVANQIIPALKLGRKVVTNIPLNESVIREHIQTGEICDLPLDRILNEPDAIDEYVTPGCLLVLDEVWKIFPAGQKVDKAPAALKTLLAEHRHKVDANNRAMQIVLVTQDLKQIANWARLLVDETFLHKKLSALGADGSYSCSIYRGGVDGQNPSANLLVRSMTGRYKKDVWQFYKSHTMSEAASAGADEKKIDRRSIIWKRPIFWGTGVAIIALTIVAPRVLGDYFTTGGAKNAKAAGPASGASGPAPAQRRQALVQGAPAQAPQYRVSAIFAGLGPESYAVLTDDRGDTVYVPAERCNRERMQWQCEFKNRWWPMRPSSSPMRDPRPITNSVAIETKPS